MQSNHSAIVRAFAVGLALTWASAASAFIANGHWTSTATDVATPPIGNPITLTWSIVPDGTNISHLSKPSNLVSFLDGIFGAGPGGSDFEERPWFELVEGCFDRWSALSGMTFTYETADDGVSGNRWHGSHPGLLGARGDVRIGGAMIDGAGNAFGQTGVLPNGDITLDTADFTHYQNTFDNYNNLRNTLTHEIGHSLGLGHVIAPSTSYQFLMESTADNSYDGPQMDDIRGVQFLYGDKYEKNGGNNSLGTAFDLGPVLPGVPIQFGLDSKTGTRVEAGETDFASVANSDDLDFFKFETQTRTQLDLVLTPVGPTYQERIPPAPIGNINTAMQSNLSLELYQEGILTPIASSSVGGLGQAESILDFELSEAGSYFVRIAGDADLVQLYTLEVSVVALPDEVRLGDFNDDGEVNAADYTLWRDHFGEADDAALLDRGDGLAGIGTGDYQIWKDSFGQTYGAGGAAALSVPEASAFATILGAIGIVFAQFRGRKVGARADPLT